MAFGPSVHQGITMNSKAREAMRFIEAFLSLLLDKRVPVNWGSHAGMSCEGSITLPTPVTGDDAEVALLTRLAMHEAGHVEETEQGYSDRLTAEELGVFNVLEDPRMEAARCDKYPGASILLSRGLGEMLRTLRDKVLSNEGSTVDAWRIDLLLRSFLAVAPHAPIREHAGDILNGLAPHISDVQRQAIDGALPIVATLKSSREAESLATSIVKQLREPEPPPLPPPQGDNGGDESEDQGAREPSASDGGEPGDQQQSNPDQEPEAGNDQGNEDADPDSGMGAEQKDAEAQGSEQGGAQEPPSDAEESSDSHEGNDGAQGQGSPAESDPQSSRPAPTEADAAHQESTAPDQSRSSSGTTSGTESNEAPQGFEQESGVQTIDLGTLLREALVERYGVAQESEALLPLPVDDRDVKRLAAVLAAADPTETAEQLLDQALVALQRTEDAETSEAGPSAGMSLAPQTTGHTSPGHPGQTGDSAAARVAGTPTQASTPRVQRRVDCRGALLAPRAVGRHQSVHQAQARHWDRLRCDHRDRLVDQHEAVLARLARSRRRVQPSASAPRRPDESRPLPGRGDGHRDLATLR
jgi:hypothetical protein